MGDYTSEFPVASQIAAAVYVKHKNNLASHAVYSKDNAKPLIIINSVSVLP